MMKLAYRVFVVSLFCFSLVAVSLAQNPAPTPRVSGTTTVSADKSKRSARDDRNTAPTFGTGGAVGGPTGLFTVFDAQTLRKGEYTFSATYSNYDRDPGDVDITDVPLNFQIGLTNNFEMFVNVDAWRGIKVNSPQNLSGFYLPNSSIFGVRRGAIILGPQGPGNGAFELRPVFRPVNTAPFVQGPFIGGSLGNFGFPVGFPAGGFFGQGNVIPTISAPVQGGAADLFPGIGSIYGSILPGIVFTTVCSQGTGPNCTNGVLIPSSYTAAPSYLNEAPFINRRWGTSAWNNVTVGGKVRFNDVFDWWGLALIAQYRFFLDSPDDFGGFNMMQRGSGPGGNWTRGDILLTLAGDGRVASWMNISANAAYHWNRSVKSEDFFGQEVTLLDRPDEFLLSVGVDFPVNRYFQPIAEFRHQRFVGGRTPNAFENDPYEVLVGARFFPARWVGFSGGYRHHFNQQDEGEFDDWQVNQTVFVPCFGFSQTGTPSGETVCPTQFISVNQSFTGVPPGFRTSSDPHGFFFQAFIGRRNERQDLVENRPANVTALSVSDSTITLGCPPGFEPRAGQTCNESTSVTVTTTAVDPENDVLTYNYTVSGGRIVGTGASVTWDLSGVAPGSYTITAGVDDGCGLCGQTQTQTVVVAACDCVEVFNCACPTVTVTGPAGLVPPGQTATFTATASGGTQQTGLTYNWTVSQGEIVSGQGTPSIVVSTTPAMAGQSIAATVTLTGFDPRCPCQGTATETVGIATLPESRLIDEFGALPADDIRGRLDTFFAELANNPTNQGYIINYGTPAQIRARERLITNHITFRGAPRDRITIVDGGASPSGEPTTRLYLVPPGAQNPNP